MAQAASRNRRLLSRIGEHSTGIVASVLFAAPIVWAVLSAFKPATE
ncbi:carbohydrate ABC transporter permease, partial [Mesorhizobium sp. M7A.F.Ca.US.001.02.1.1]